MKTYGDLLLIFQKLKEHTDYEATHIMADGYLCEIAKLAAMGKLNLEQVNNLISLYQSLHKWYA